MTTIKIDNDNLLDCQIGEFVATRSKGSECCEGIFKYKPLVVSFEKETQPRVLLESNAIAVMIETQFQIIWLLGITKKEMLGDGKVAIYFDNCIII